MNASPLRTFNGLDLNYDSAVENIRLLLGAVRVLDIQGNIQFGTIRSELTEIAYQYTGAVIEFANNPETTE